jgi:hypothetical protein
MYLLAVPVLLTLSANFKNKLRTFTDRRNGNSARYQINLEDCKTHNL